MALEQVKCNSNIFLRFIFSKYLYLKVENFGFEKRKTTQLLKWRESKRVEKWDSVWRTDFVPHSELAFDVQMPSMAKYEIFLLHIHLTSPIPPTMGPGLGAILRPAVLPTGWLEAEARSSSARLFSTVASPKEPVLPSSSIPFFRYSSITVAAEIFQSIKKRRKEEMFDARLLT